MNKNGFVENFNINQFQKTGKVQVTGVHYSKGFLQSLKRSFRR